MRPPFPWFGNKATAAAAIWQRLGNPKNYVEPFAGSLAVLLARPDEHQWWSRFETVNDADALIPNFFRAIAGDPEQVAAYASAPVTEVDLTARHLWLVQQRDSLAERLMADPDIYDARAAGWWAWGISAWVGGDWCTGIGPYTGTGERPRSQGGTAPGVFRKIPMVAGGHGGKGTHRPRPLPGGPAVESPSGGLVPDITGGARAILAEDFAVLANRLRRVRVVCGDWERVTRSAATPPKGHHVGVLLDPPYAPTARRGDLYGVGDRPEHRDAPVHEAARAWALAQGADPRYRIAYCTYRDHSTEDALFAEAGWTPHAWSARGGYGLQSDNRAVTNRHLEVVWFSPHCLPAHPPQDPQGQVVPLLGCAPPTGGPILQEATSDRLALEPVASTTAHAVTA